MKIKGRPETKTLLMIVILFCWATLIHAAVPQEINYQGFLTDADGNFQLNLKAGRYKVSIAHISMKREEYYFQVYSSGSVLLEMRRELKELDEVVVSASQNDNVLGMQMGYERITVKSIKEIPLVMGEKDLLKVATMLPGVESAGEGSSGRKPADHQRKGTAAHTDYGFR